MVDKLDVVSGIETRSSSISQMYKYQTQFEDLLTHRFLGLGPRVSDSVSLG